jgi:hypothetical protein
MPEYRLALKWDSRKPKDNHWGDPLTIALSDTSIPAVIDALKSAQEFMRQEDDPQYSSNYRVLAITEVSGEQQIPWFIIRPATARPKEEK